MGGQFVDCPDRVSISSGDGQPDQINEIMQKTPNQKGFTKKVKRVCSFKGFNQKREKRKEKYTLDDKGKKIEFLI